MIRLVLLVLKFALELALYFMKDIERKGDNDADGVPLSDDYRVLGYIVPVLRDLIHEVEVYEKENAHHAA